MAPRSEGSASCHWVKTMRTQCESGVCYSSPMTSGWRGTTGAMRTRASPTRVVLAPGDQGQSSVVNKPGSHNRQPETTYL